PSDVKVSNGKIGGAKRVNSTTYTAKFKAIEEGLTKISIPAGKFTNAQGDKNSASSEFIWTYDATPPQMSIEITQINQLVKSMKILINKEAKGDSEVLPSDDEILRLQFTSSEIITGFVVSDVVANGGLLSEFKGSEMSYSAIFTPSEPGPKDFELAVGSFVDAAGNANEAISFSSTYIPPIGSEYGGGVIAYVFTPHDSGYVAGEVHGLIAAKSDQSLPSGAPWYNGSFNNTAATGAAVGKGRENTELIVLKQGEATNEVLSAARLCADYAVTEEAETYDDWFLPSKGELNKLYLNKEMIGGFEDDGYWSSTEEDQEGAWRQSFYNGYQNYGNKRSEGSQGTASGYYGRHVRAIRTF
ncbi:MAG: Ig-like domain-containing protein, partial [Cyclobacteriaceae bacterium]